MFEKCQASHKHVNGVLTKMSLSPVVGTCLVRTAPQATGLKKTTSSKCVSSQNILSHSHRCITYCQMMHLDENQSVLLSETGLNSVSKASSNAPMRSSRLLCILNSSVKALQDDIKKTIHLIKSNSLFHVDRG